MIQIISTPGRTAPTGSESRWSAAGNSVDFVFQRKDRVIQKAVNVGYTRIFMTTPAPDLAIGDRVYIGDVLNRYTGVHTVIAVGSGTFDIGVLFTSNTVGFVNLISLFPSYVLQVTIESSENDIVLECPSSASGLIRCDASGMLRSYLDIEEGYNFDLINRQDIGADLEYSLYYREIFSYDGSTIIGGPPKSEGNQYRVTNSVKQIGDAYGQNMREYMTYPYATGNEMKFMDAANEPTYFPGYPYSLSFIYSELSPAYELNRHIEQLDVNRTLIASTGTDKRLSSASRDHVNHLTLRNMAALDSKARYLRLWLDETDEAEDDGYAGGGGSTGGGVGTGVGGTDASYMDDDYAGG